MKKTFVVGDVHGCSRTFDRLLQRAKFDPDEHRLWLVGDLVNTGPDSLGMLRRATDLHERMGKRFRMVLGNHEIHLLQVAEGRASLRSKDTLDRVLEARDRRDLLRWLRRRRLVHRHKGYLLVHAGLLPEWSVDDAVAVAKKLSRKLRSGKPIESRRKARALSALTRIRMLDDRDRMSTYSGPPEQAPKKLRPWFDLWSRRRRQDEPLTVLFGHWAALGQRRGGKAGGRWISLDSGCVYGRTLTALRLPDGKLIEQACLDDV